MAGLALLRAVAPDWPLAVRTLVLTGVLVPIISLGIAPVVAWLMDGAHLQKRKDPSKTGACCQTKPQSRNQRPKLNRRIAIRDS
ncbi:hypothetical protein ACSQ76_14255 [Roseovarius sp. B08]|uniref:hypothetical protein n=1 Tax=Roseovarius sp. B08 TaxID=3449223 RepID=UPI003EDB8642